MISERRSRAGVYCHFFVTHKEEDNLFEEIMDMIDEHHRIFETGGYASWSKRHKGRTT